MTLALVACGGEDSPSSALSPLDSDEGEGSAPAEAADPTPVDMVPAEVETPADPSADAQGVDAESAAQDEGAPDPDLAPPEDSGTARAELEWRNCGQFEDRNLQCAEVLVPVDYDQPEGEQVSIAMRRIQANPLEPYHGALLFNPGGPGGEGIDSTFAFFRGDIFDAIAPGYDIIGFDPRGVGASGETGCGIQPENMYPGATPTGEIAPGFADFVAYLEAEGERCEAAWGPLFRRLGSNNVVRDLEEMRKALNEPLLNFYGASYGTRLGSLYAHSYPETTGRIVLDAAVQPRSSLIETVRGQFKQAVNLHELFLSRCDSAELACPPDARLVFDQLLASASALGLEPAFVNLWTTLLLDLEGVDACQQLLAAQVADPSGAWIPSLFSEGGGGSVGFSDVVNRSVHCTDDAFEPPTQEEFESLGAEFRQLSPVFADTFLPSTTLCAGWPVTRDPVPMPTATTARPLLVIGGTADGLTPYEWSQQMTEALGSATLLTSNHYGHGAVTRGSDCVRAVIRAYLTSGSLPATGATCS